MRVQQVAEDLFNKQKHQQNHAKPSTSKSDTHKLATHGNTWQHALEDYEELSEHHRTSHQRIAGVFERDRPPGSEHQSHQLPCSIARGRNRCPSECG